MCSLGRGQSLSELLTFSPSHISLFYLLRSHMAKETAAHRQENGKIRRGGKEGGREGKKESREVK